MKIILALTLAVFTTQIWADTKMASYLLENEKNTIEIFQKVAPAVVNVSNVQYMRVGFFFDVTEQPAGSGSGFIWDPAGHIVTNYHVVQGANKIFISFKQGKTASAKVVGVEKMKDIAVLKVDFPQGVDPVSIMPANSSELLVGQKTIALGSPFGLDQTLTQGVVSALGRAVPGIGGVTIHDMIQTDAPINPGNSGGPLLDSRGYLIGMNTMIYSKSGSSAGIGFAVPANTIVRVVTQIIKYGHVLQPSLGIAALDDSIAEQIGVEGVIIMEVIKGGPAQKAGLKGTVRNSFGEIILGDIIVKIDNDEIKNYDNFYSSLEKHKIGDEAKVTYIRNREKHTISVRLE